MIDSYNDQGYLAGEKLRLAEVGPYVYEEKWERVGVAWSNDYKQVKFKMKRSYFFRPDLTSGSLEDLVTLPNVPMFVCVMFFFTSHLSSVSGHAEQDEEHWTRPSGQRQHIHPHH